MHVSPAVVQFVRAYYGFTVVRMCALYHIPAAYWSAWSSGRLDPPPAAAQAIFRDYQILCSGDFSRRDLFDPIPRGCGAGQKLF
jgi:hypothetical protein